MICDYCDAKITTTATTAGFATRQLQGLTTAACYACCGWLDIMAMRRGEDPGLFASDRQPCEQWTVGNWPGTLTMRVIRTATSRHNMAGKATTLHFEGPDGQVWTGTEYHGPTSGNLLRKVRPLKHKPRRWQ